MSDILSIYIFSQSFQQVINGDAANKFLNFRDVHQHSYVLNAWVSRTCQISVKELFAKIVNFLWNKTKKVPEYHQQTLLEVTIF